MAAEEIAHAVRAHSKTSAYKRIDSRTFESMTKIDGKPTTTSRIVISADGKTLTATTTGKKIKGETVNSVVVADKQLQPAH